MYKIWCTFAREPLYKCMKYSYRELVYVVFVRITYIQSVHAFNILMTLVLKL